MIKEATRKAEADIAKLTEDIKDHISRYGEGQCDYLTSRQMRLMYHKGELNALQLLKGVTP